MHSHQVPSFVRGHTHPYVAVTTMRQLGFNCSKLPFRYLTPKNLLFQHTHLYCQRGSSWQR